MPLHQYKCPTCGHKEEHLQTYKEGENLSFYCPRCKVLLVRLTGNITYFRIKGER